MAVFDTIDIDGGGTVDKDEIYDALQEAGVKISEEGVATLFNMIDEDGSGEIDKDEWKEAVNFYLELKQEEKEMARQDEDTIIAQKNIRAMKLAQLGVSVKAVKKKKSKMESVIGLLSRSSTKDTSPDNFAKDIRFEEDCVEKVDIQESAAKAAGIEKGRNDFLRGSMNSSSHSAGEPLTF